MSFKFNRGCWVDSWEETLLREKFGKRQEPKGESSMEDSGARESRDYMLPIEKKIEFARFLFLQWGDELLKDLTVRRYLRQLEEGIEVSGKTMKDLGIDQACALCDATAPEGSCCSRGLENKYDVVLLLINLLLGVDLQTCASRADSCAFLGPKGCRLRARNLICIEYLCPQLERSLGHDALVRMQTATGGELEASFLLCDAIRKRITS